jgi:hypothetical protein
MTCLNGVRNFSLLTYSQKQSVLHRISFLLVLRVYPIFIIFLVIKSSSSLGHMGYLYTYLIKRRKNYNKSEKDSSLFICLLLSLFIFLVFSIPQNVETTEPLRIMVTICVRYEVLDGDTR